MVEQPQYKHKKYEDNPILLFFFKKNKEVLCYDNLSN